MLTTIPVITQVPSSVAPGETIMQTIELRFNVSESADLVIAPMPSNEAQCLMFYFGREFHVAMSTEALERELRN